MKKNQKTSYIIAVVMSLFALLIFYVSRDWPEYDVNTGYGPGFYPRMLAVVLVILSVLLVIDESIKAARARKAEQASDAAKDERILKIDELKFPLIFMGLMAAYTLLLNVLGFILDTIIFLFAGTQILKGKLVTSIIISAVFSFAIYFIFANLLRVNLPTGMIF